LELILIYLDYNDNKSYIIIINTNLYIEKVNELNIINFSIF